jgi:hypothetical protein
MTESKNLISLFNESKYYSLKYKNYFPIYEKLFSRFKNAAEFSFNSLLSLKKYSSKLFFSTILHTMYVNKCYLHTMYVNMCA